MSLKPYLSDRERGIPPRLPQEVIDEIIGKDFDELNPQEVIILDNATKRRITIEEFVENFSTFNSTDLYKDLARAQEFASDGGFVASMPVIIAACMHDKEHEIQRLHDIASSSELHWFTDKEGVLGKVGAEYWVVIHMNGLILSNYGNSGKWRVDKPNNKFPPGPSIEDIMPSIVTGDFFIPAYTPQDILDGKVKNPFGDYAVYGERIKKIFKHLVLSPESFETNPFALAIAGTPKYLKAFSKDFGRYWGEIKTRITYDNFFTEENTEGCLIQLSHSYPQFRNNFGDKRGKIMAYHPTKERVLER